MVRGVAYLCLFLWWLMHTKLEYWRLEAANHSGLGNEYRCRYRQKQHNEHIGANGRLMELSSIFQQQQKVVVLAFTLLFSTTEISIE